MDHGGSIQMVNDENSKASDFFKNKKLDDIRTMRKKRTATVL